MSYNLIFSCEHAGNEIPEKYQALFHTHEHILQTHRGWDIGAWTIAEFLALQFNVPLFGCHTSRLLIEANRSLTSSQLFSEYTSTLSHTEKAVLIAEYYTPYRTKVEKQIDAMLNPVLHLSIHSFTPIWNGEERAVDIGILFDPARKSESKISQQLKDNLKLLLPDFKIKLNEPYKGTDDGFTTWLRTHHADNAYAGIEIEVNQKYSNQLSTINNSLAKAIKDILSNNF